MIDKLTFTLNAASSFDNNKYSNALFLDNLADTKSSDFSRSKNVKYNAKEECIELIDLTSEGEYLTVVISTDSTFGGALDKFFLMVRESGKANSIEYFLIFDDDKMLPIKPNNNVPLNVYGRKPSNFKLLVKLNPYNNESPKLYGYAVSYFDKMVLDQMGLIKPNLRPTGDVEEEKIFLEFESLEEFM